MAIYPIKMPDGNIIRLKGDSPPTEQELESIFSSLPPARATSSPNQRFPGEGVFPPDRLTSTQRAAFSGIPGGPLIAPFVSGRPVTALEAGAETGLEEIARIPGQLGEVAVSGMVPAPARLGAAILESLGVIPKDSLQTQIERLIAPAKRAPELIESALGIDQGSERAKFREPEAAAIAEIGAQFFPPVAAIPEVAAAGGRAVKAAVELPGAIRGAVEKLSSRGITRAPLEDVITKATGITPQEGSLDLIPIVKNRIVEATKKTPKTATEAIEATDKASDFVIQKALKGLKQAEGQGLAFAGNSAIDAGRAQVLRDFPSLEGDAEAVQAVLKEFDYLKGNIKPTKGQGYLRELNFKYEGLENKNSPAASAYRAVRSSLSDQLDELYKAGTGLNESPYRDWGQLQQFRAGVSDQIISSQRVEGGRAEKMSRGVPVSKAGVVTKGLKSLARPFIPREIEAVDKSIGRSFSEIQDLPPVSNLSDVDLQVLRAKYLPKATPPALPVSASKILDDKIQALIKTYPTDIRSNPQLARKVAEAELSQSP